MSLLFRSLRQEVREFLRNDHASRKDFDWIESEATRDDLTVAALLPAQERLIVFSMQPFER